MGLTVTAGFVVIFAAIGFVVSEISSVVFHWIPWITMVVGAVLVILGVAMVRGYQPTIGLPKPGGARKGSDLRAMFTYGLSYATVSLGCSLTPFLAVVATSFKQSNTAAGVALFVAYALGMGLVVVVVSMALALAQQAFVGRMRTVLPYVQRASGAALVVAGGYVAYYGWYERRLLNGTDTSLTGGSLVDRVTGWSASISSFVQNHVGPSALVAALVVVTAVAIVAVVASNTPEH